MLRTIFFDFQPSLDSTQASNEPAPLPVTFMNMETSTGHGPVWADGKSTSWDALTSITPWNLSGPATFAPAHFSQTISLKIGQPASSTLSPTVTSTSYVAQTSTAILC